MSSHILGISARQDIYWFSPWIHDVAWDNTMERSPLEHISAAPRHGDKLMKSLFNIDKMLKASQLVHDFRTSRVSIPPCKIHQFINVSVSFLLDVKSCKANAFLGKKTTLIPGLVEMKSWINPRTKRWRPWQMILCVAWWNSEQYYIKYKSKYDFIEPLPNTS